MFTDEKQPNSATAPEILTGIFDDYEGRRNFVGFFDLLYKIDRRLEPERYEEGAEDHD